jgi:prophage regulatory protein
MCARFSEKENAMSAAEFNGLHQAMLGRVVINRKQLKSKVPLCERTILDLEKRGKFPKRFSVAARVVVWDLSEVDDWIADQKAAGIQQPAPGIKR